MVFETTLDDFDSVFPGTYQGRIRRVTVNVQGIVPPAGISGSPATAVSRFTGCLRMQQRPPTQASCDFRTPRPW